MFCNEAALLELGTREVPNPSSWFLDQLIFPKDPSRWASMASDQASFSFRKVVITKFGTVNKLEY